MKLIGTYLIASGVLLAVWGVMSVFQGAHYGSNLRIFFRDEIMGARLDENVQRPAELERASAAFERQSNSIMNWQGYTALGLVGAGVIQGAVGVGVLIMITRSPNQARDATE